MNGQLVIQAPNPRLEICAFFEEEGEVVLLSRLGPYGIPHFEETWVIMDGVFEELRIVEIEVLSVDCQKRRLR